MLNGCEIICDWDGGFEILKGTIANQLFQNAGSLNDKDLISCIAAKSRDLQQGLKANLSKNLNQKLVKILLFTKAAKSLFIKG